MRVLITGITGFVGPYLAEYIFAHHPEVAVWGMAFGDVGREQLVPLQPKLRILEGNLGDLASLRAVLEEAQPDIIFHLAAASSVGDSWVNPAMVLEINVIGQINLFEAARAAHLRPLIVVSSSGEIYGQASLGNIAATEDAALEPQSPYATSKAAQDLIAYQYDVSGTLPTIRLRLFNHTGPRRQPNFVASSFANRIAEIERGKREPVLDVGNLDAIRDFSDVRDVVRAYWLAATRGAAGAAYNVCSGNAVSIQNLLDRLLAMTDVRIQVRQNPALLRAADIPILYGNHDRFTAATGWSPEIPLDTTLADLLAWWRSQAGGTQ